MRSDVRAGPALPRAVAAGTWCRPARSEVPMKFRPAAPTFLTATLAVLAFGLAGEVMADPPSRVARIGYLGGEVSFAPAGEDTWYSARINRPLVTNDRLWTGQRGRVELQLGTAFVRL